MDARDGTDGIAGESAQASRRASAGGTWRRVGLAVSLAVVAAVVLALGLVLTGIIAEPETLLVDTLRWILGK